MALTKIGKEGITGISNASDATFLTATSGEGVTLAGTLAVTGVHTVGTNAVATSDGGAVTTSVIQGLIKTWCNWDNDATGIVDSLNIGSFTDVGSGDSRLVYTNNMGNAIYCITTCAIHDGGVYVAVVAIDHDTPPTASQIDFDLMNNNNDARLDTEMNMMQVTGDLA